jgi:integrase
MAKVRVRPETGTLQLDFFYRGVRCREQTALPDTAENRKKVQALLNRIQKEIAQGGFDYTMTFPSSPRATQFSGAASVGPLVPLLREAGSSLSAINSASTPVITDFAEQWFVEMSPQWRRLHRSGVRDILDKNVLPVFGERRIDEVTKSDVLAYRAEVAKLPGRRGTLGNARINKIMCVLRQILNEAADRYDVKSAFRGVKPLKQKKTDVQAFSLDEVNRIVDTVRADYRNYLVTRFFTGMRSGEINGLQWKYVEMDRNLILVRQTFASGELDDDAKNSFSIRDIPMQPIVREAIEAQLRRRTPAEPWVFPTSSGGPIDTNNFANRIWYPLLRYLELDKRRPYQTRHTAATLMLAAGENPEWIAKILGHANTDMLFRVYSRFVPNLTRQDGRAFAGLINSHSGAPHNQELTQDDIETMDPETLRRELKAALLAKNRPSLVKASKHPSR